MVEPLAKVFSCGEGFSEACAEAYAGLPPEAGDFFVKHPVKNSSVSGYHVAPVFWRKNGNTVPSYYYTDYEIGVSALLSRQDFLTALRSQFSNCSGWRMIQTKRQVNRYRPGEGLGWHSHHISGGLGGRRMVLVIPLYDEDQSGQGCLSFRASENAPPVAYSVQVGEAVLFDGKILHQVVVNRRRTVLSVDVIIRTGWSASVYNALF